MELTNKICFWKRGRGRLLLSAVVTLLLFALVLSLLSVSFLSNDDSNIAYAVAGYRGGTPYPTHPFINCMLGIVVSSLYTAFAAVPWWGVLQLVMLYVSITVIGYAILTACQKYHCPLCIAIILHVLLFWVVDIYAILQLTFTLTSSLLGTASVALILVMEPGENGERKFILPMVTAAVLLFLCFLFRNSTGIGTLPFIGSALLYRILRCLQVTGEGNRRLLGGTLILSACCVAITVLCISVNKWGLRHYNTETFIAQDTARSDYIDYGKMDYNEAPWIYTAEGWSEALTNLTQHWFFMDERVTMDALSTIASNVHDEQAKQDSILHAVVRGEKFFRTNGPAEYTVALPFGLFVLAVLAFCKDKKKWLPMIAVCCICAGAFMLCLYLSAKSRLILRTFQVVAIPATLMLLLFVLEMIDGKNPFGMKGQKLGWRILSGVVCSITLLGCVWSAAKTTGVALRYDPSEKIQIRRDTVAYVTEHSENIYIRDTRSADEIDAFAVYPDEKPINLIDWGGCDINTGARREQLLANGLTEADYTSALFERDNVFFLTEIGGRMLHLLTEYMEESRGASGVTLVDDLGNGIGIYHFSF